MFWIEQQKKARFDFLIGKLGVTKGHFMKNIKLIIVCERAW